MNEPPLALLFRNKIVRAILIIDVIVVIVLVGIAIAQSFKTSTLTLNVVPVNSKILVNGKKYQNGSYPLHPGTHKIEISHPDLDTKIFDIKLEAEHNLAIATFLKKGDDLSFYTRKDSLPDFYHLEQIASASSNFTYDRDTSAEAFISKTRTALDLYNNALPIEYQEYEKNDGESSVVVDVSIKQHYGQECQTFLCIKAFILGAADEAFANTLLIDAGFKLEDYEIYYKTY